MASNGKDLPAYDELIESLAARLEGLSAVHAGLGEAARSLVGAQRALAETKRAIETLAASSEGMVEEVRRLKPAELGAVLDASLDRAARETSRELGALSARLGAMTTEAAASRKDAEAGLASIERTFMRSLANLGERQDLLVTMADDAHQRQDEQARRHDALLPPLAELRLRQVDLANAVADVRGVAESTRLETFAISRTTDAVGAAIEALRGDLMAELARARRRQIVTLVALLIALGLTVVVLAGRLPLI